MRTTRGWGAEMGSRMWPLFTNHHEARCFACKRTMSVHDAKPSGMPHGHGEFRGTCQICMVFTWYDVSDPTPLADVQATSPGQAGPEWPSKGRVEIIRAHLASWDLATELLARSAR